MKLTYTVKHVTKMCVMIVKGGVVITHQNKGKQR
jgi:hypothetical protein